MPSGKTPKQIIDRLCEGAMWMWLLTDCGKRHKAKPGEYFYSRTTPEEREILKNLKAEDLQNTLRPELFWDIKPSERR